MGFQWETKPTAVFPQAYQSHSQAVFAYIVEVAEKNGKEGAVWMKANHKWENVTGKAEAGLTVDVTASPMERVEMTFNYGADVPYDIFLELANAGRFAILAPAVDLFGVKVMNELKGMANVSFTKPVAG